MNIKVSMLSVPCIEPLFPFSAVQLLSAKLTYVNGDYTVEPSYNIAKVRSI